MLQQLKQTLRRPKGLLQQLKQTLRRPKGLLEELKQPRPWQQPRPDCPAYRARRDVHRHAGLQNTFHIDFFNHWKSTRVLCLSRPLFSLLRQLGHLRSHLPQRQHLEGHHLGHLVDALHLLHQCHHCRPAGHHLPHPPPHPNSGAPRTRPCASCLTLRGGLGQSHQPPGLHHSKQKRTTA